ncbi:MAG: DUF3786 domain-containing protein [Lachnospiraceae bacterium]|nr:DUF3786 domain-containing protein [Lachnospiraceae bacterium]
MENKEFDYAKDNLEMRPLEHYLELYKAADPAEMAARTGTAYNADTKEFYLHVMGKGYYVSHPDFNIRKEKEEDASYHALLDFHKTKIFVLRFLTECQMAPASGKYVTYRDIPDGELYFRQFQGRCIFRLQFGFGYKLDKFRAGMEMLGGKSVKMGDVAYSFEFMDGLSMIFIFWEGDDEFQPSAQILFSDNFATVFKAEDLAVAGDISIGNLKAIV